MADINPILNQARIANQAVDSGSVQIQSARTEQASYAESSADTFTDIGNLNNIIETTKKQAELETQLASAKAGSIFGADLRKQNELISKNQEMFEAAFQQRMLALKDIQSKDSVGFMDNPLGYIVNQFSVNDDIKKHNAALDIEQASKTHIDNINQMSSQTAVNQKNFEVSLTQAAVDANSKKILDEAALKANEARIAGIGYNIEGIKEAINAPIQKLQILSQVNAAEDRQTQLKIALDNYALHKEEFKWKQDEKAAAKEGDDYIIDRMNKGFALMYGANAPNLAVSPTAARQQLALFKSNSAAGKEAVAAYMAGQSGILGGAPSQIIGDIKSGMNLDFKQPQLPIKKLFEESVQDVRNLPETQKPKNAAEANAILDQTVYKKLEEYTKTLGQDPTNPLNIGPVSGLIQLPGVVNTAFAQKVLAPAINTQDLDRPDKVWTLGIKAVKDGTITQADLVTGIEALYVKGVAVNAAQKSFTQFGIAPTREMGQYKVNVPTDAEALWGTSERVDLTDKNKIAAAVNKTLAKELARKFSANLSGSGAGVSSQELELYNK